MASVHRKDSFLKNAGVYDGFLDVNALPQIPKSVADTEYTIEPKYHQRPDLLASKLYSNSRLWWVFAIRNPDMIEDPIRDFKQGLSIFVPTKNTIEQVTG